MTRLLRNIPKDRKIYGNCQVLSPEGILMFRCDDRKANWYLKRDLGIAISDNPLVVKLKFEPKGLGNHNRDFGLSDMPNICVVCGVDSHLTRHHVVPYCYRRCFPLEVKSHNHHDVLSVCVDCHEKYEEMATKFKKQIADELNVSMENGMSPEQIKNKKILSARNLLERVSKGEITGVPEDRLEIIKLKAKEELVEEISIHGAAWADGIMKVIIESDDMYNFVKRWREHFVKHMSPQYLPKYWSIDSPLEKSGKVEI